VTQGERFDGPEPRPPGKSPLVLLGGVVVAVVVGAGLALFFAPQMDNTPAPAPDDSRVSILVDPGKPPPIPKSNGQMEVLGPGMAEAAAPPPAAVVPPLDAAPVEPARSGPSFDCNGRLTRGQEMVCANPDLAAADLRMARAYAAAAAAGAPTDDLRAEQADWRAIREDAAAHSPDAVAQIYEQRTRELQELAGYMQRR